MDRPDSETPTLVEPALPADDAEARWLGFHALRLAMGVLGQGRTPEAVLAEDLAEPAFASLLPGDGSVDPTAPLDWDRVAVSCGAQSVTLRSESGLERTVVRNGRYGLQAGTANAAGSSVAAKSRVAGPWPVGSEPDPAHLSAGVVARIQELVDRLTGDGLGRAVVVVHRGKLVAESYARGFPREMRHNGWSATKSVAGVLAGRLVHEGLLEPDQPVPIPEWASDERSAVTLRQLLAMASGLDCPAGVTAWARGDRHFRSTRGWTTCTARWPGSGCMLHPARGAPTRTAIRCFAPKS
ncbi:serine hydrolase [Amycolatopsis jiangsuensis]|uniref:Beta-lactamase-related domain-containing protein n=1 Tax=Amycolatopsis jiangsuensis TaxID=1181879 RepID=A0A840IS80_9PSEU|nr:serine hydrolase [Amycolatopsis jiangsuensis]MBB4685266.1 hypothetical protein [Amycolatopsis jiangsuensis]